MGTILPVAAALNKKLVDRLQDANDFLFRLLPYRHIRVHRQAWEDQYECKDWDCLRGIDELAHYSVIVGYCDYLEKNGAILDVGCGEGILQERLRSGGYSCYLGIDLSAQAISRASRREDCRTHFMQADVATYEPNRTFDVIIFNECMYYFETPLTILQRYEHALTDGGIFIVSMHATHRSRRLWKSLETAYGVDDKIVVTNRSGVSWAVAVLSPPSRTEPVIQP